MVGAAELGTGGGEATTGSDGGQSGADSGGSVHLCRDSELDATAKDLIAFRGTYLEVEGTE